MYKLFTEIEQWHVKLFALLLLSLMGTLTLIATSIVGILKMFGIILIP